MALTLANLEEMLVRRVKKYMVRVGLDTTTVDGTNADLRDAIYAATWGAGLTTAGDFTEDADLAGAAGFVRAKLVDLAELSLLQTCWGNWAEVDQTADSESQSLNQITKDLAARIDFLTAKVARPYGTAEQTGLNPGPSASGLIRAGRCYPGDFRPRLLPWRGGWCYPCP